VFRRGRFATPVLVAIAVSIGMLAVPAYASAAEVTEVQRFQIRDDCDPATFNAAIGPGTCIGNGDVTFARFLATFQRLHRVPQWHFVPDHARMVVGQSFKATNVGGELHSFTEVPAFGNGIVGPLNQPTGAPPSAACAAAAGTIGQPGSSFVFPGQSFTDTETISDVGHPVLYQCCIHPWMHAVIRVRQPGRDDD
jgi:hypothetical protein